jgi:hypothetical protein
MDQQRIAVYGVCGFITGGLLGLLVPIIFPEVSDVATLIIISVGLGLICAFLGIKFSRLRDKREANMSNPSDPTSRSDSALRRQVPRITWLLVLVGIVIGLALAATGHV